MHPFVSIAASFVLGGVPVQVSGLNTATPMEPDATHPEVLATTRQISPGTSILMSNEERWTVRAKNMNGPASRVTIAPPGSPTVQVVVVPNQYADAAIWWVGDLNPPPPSDDPGEPTTGVPGDPGPNTTPMPPAPTEPPPTEPPAPPLTQLRMP